MAARYLIRFDDICPTMNWSIWTRVEAVLNRYGVKPILAVVPDNQDKKLQVDAAREDFWDRVRDWQARGWTIGWHGYQHLYSSNSAGVIGIHEGSEFAGLREQEQHEKLRRAAEIFQQQGVKPEVWVAPGHSFDMTTVRLLPKFGVDLISDGFHWRVVRDGGCRWIPQQLWRFRQVPFGLWTVCFHINAWRERDVERLEANVSSFGDALIPMSAALEHPPALRGLYDRAFSNIYRRAVVARQVRAGAGTH